MTDPVAQGRPAVLTLAKLDFGIQEGDVIQKAAALGTPARIDLLNTGILPAPVVFPTQTQANGIYANGSVWLQNQVRLSELKKLGTKILVSGSIALDNGGKPVTQSGDVTTAGELLSSSALPAQFPGTFAVAAGVKKSDLVNDGWNKIKAQTLGLDYSSNTRNVKPFEPVKIDSAENLARYRALTRNSADGVYIGNGSDVEKVSLNAAAATFRPMTQAELVKMWTSSATTDPYMRNTPASTTATDSLEQKHLRGWIGPDEFLPRGALVELVQNVGQNPRIRITSDARSDDKFNGLDDSKAFRDANGVTQKGVYTREFVWPKNGTLFAEGNLRIRGKVNLANLTTGTDPDNYPSLTVVSLGNIYVEGSVSVDTPTITNPKKLMLTAKKNVIVNPTRLVLGHVDEQTVSTNPVALGLGGIVPDQTATIPVANPSAFQIGDVIETYDTSVNPPALGVRGIVATRDLTTKLLTAKVLTGTTVAPNSAVKTLLSDATGNAGGTKFFTATADNAIERRVLLQNADVDYPNLRLAIDHIAQRQEVFKVETERFGVDPDDGVTLLDKPADLEVKVTNKRVAAGGAFDTRSPIVKSDAKRIRAVFNRFTPGTDVFPDETTNPFNDPAESPTPGVSIAENQARVFSLASLEAEINALPGRQNNVVKKGWKYKATNSATPATIPFFYLAGIGLRDDSASPNVTVANGVDIGTADFDIPLATSVRLSRNNTSEPLTSFYSGDDGAGNSVVANYTVPFLGFNPNHGSAASPNDANFYADAVSVDQSFYQTDANILRSILDSRGTNTPFASNDALVLRQNTDLLFGTTAIALPDYRVRALKLENTNFPAVNTALPAPIEIRPVDLEINAFVYAQEGSWFVIPGDYFRTGNPVRSDNNTAGTASYIDLNDNGSVETGEYVNGTNAGNDPNAFDAGDGADLNRNGISDPGEAEAAFRFVRYNYQIRFYGAIIENQSPVLADVKLNQSSPVLVEGAVQDWTNKWAAYNSTLAGANATDKFQFITYTYDPAIQKDNKEANQLRIPVTDDLLYEQ